MIPLNAGPKLSKGNARKTRPSWPYCQGEKGEIAGVTPVDNKSQFCMALTKTVNLCQ